jgi:hypothetical protein
MVLPWEGMRWLSLVLRLCGLVVVVALFVMLLCPVPAAIDESRPTEAVVMLLFDAWTVSVGGAVLATAYMWRRGDRRERHSMWLSAVATLPGVVFTIECVARLGYADELGLARVAPYDLTTLLFALLGALVGPVFLVLGFREIALGDASRPLLITRAFHGLAWLLSSWAAIFSAAAV